MYFEGNEATVNRYDAQASGASDWSVVWGGSGSVRVGVVVVSIGVVLGVVWRCWGKFLLVCVAYVFRRWWVCLDIFGHICLQLT